MQGYLWVIRRSGGTFFKIPLCWLSDWCVCRCLPACRVCCLACYSVVGNRIALLVAESCTRPLAYLSRAWPWVLWSMGVPRSSVKSLPAPAPCQAAAQASATPLPATIYYWYPVRRGALWGAAPGGGQCLPQVGKRWPSLMGGSQPGRGGPGLRGVAPGAMGPSDATAQDRIIPNMRLST